MWIAIEGWSSQGIFSNCHPNQQVATMCCCCFFCRPPWANRPANTQHPFSQLFNNFPNPRRVPDGRMAPNSRHPTAAAHHTAPYCQTHPNQIFIVEIVEFVGRPLGAHRRASSNWPFEQSHPSVMHIQTTTQISRAPGPKNDRCPPPDIGNSANSSFT